MKLLFDQNLSYKLCSRLFDLFPDSAQVSQLGLARVDDRVVWEHAKAGDFVLADLAALLGPAPKVI